MKKTIAFFLTVIIALAYILPLNIYADETAKNELERVSNAVTYSFEYNHEMSVIKINGTMSHDAMIKYKGYSLVIYRVGFGQSIYDVINNAENKPIATSDISIKFQFSFEIGDIYEKYSKYAVLLRSPEGTLILTDDPQYVTEDSDYNSIKRKSFNFKGILLEDGNYGMDTLPGTVIIPVRLNETFSNIPKGYLYQNNFSQLYFSSEYVNALDAKINAAVACGGRVYLQYLLPSEMSEWGFEGSNAEAEYLMPCVYSKDFLNYVDALTSFLAERYNGKQNGAVSGIVLGKQIDLHDKYNNCGEVDIERYAEYYFDYLSVVSVAAHSINTAIEIVIPFSAQNSYTKAKQQVQGFDSSILLEAILKKCDLYRGADFELFTLIENENSPLSVDETQTVLINDNEGIIGAENISIYEEYLKKTASKYSQLSKSYMYVWTPSESVKGNELVLSYAYMYYKLCVEQTAMDSFSVSFERNDNYSDIKNIIKHIDDNESLSYTRNALTAFGINDWVRLIPSFTIDNVVTHSYAFSEPIGNSELEYKGEHSYIEISEMSTLASWSVGNHCKKMYISQHSTHSYVVKADFENLDSIKECGEIYYVYDKSESFLFTPFISFELMAETTDNANAIYEIGVSLISDNNNSIETKYSLKANELTEFSMNVGNYAINNKIKAIKITVREISGNNDSFSLLLKSISGKSQEYTSREIESKIFEERINSIKQETPQSDKNNENVSYGVILAVILAVVGVCLGAWISFKKDSTEQKQ